MKSLRSKSKQATKLNQQPPRSTINTRNIYTRFYQILQANNCRHLLLLKNQKARRSLWIHILKKKYLRVLKRRTHKLTTRNGQNQRVLDKRREKKREMGLVNRSESTLFLILKMSIANLTILKSLPLISVKHS